MVGNVLQSVACDRRLSASSSFAMEFLDMESFINEVRKRPALWDYSSDDYKNRPFKEKQWEEIALIFFPDKGKDKERIQMGKDLKMKWRHIRDAYIRNLRLKYNLKRSGVTGKPIKPYVYAKQMYFLKTIFHSDPMQEDFIEIKAESLMQLQEDNSDAAENLTPLEQIVAHHTDNFNGDTFQGSMSVAPAQSMEETESYNPRQPHRKVVKKKRNLDQKIEDLIDGLEKQMPRKVNVDVVDDDEDMSFFRSLLPHVQTLTNVDKLKFRTDVMNLLISYSEPRQPQSNLSSSHRGPRTQMHR